MDFRKTISDNHLSSALADISTTGRHWFSLPSSGASMLEQLVAENGYDVFLFELPPEWEHVLALKGHLPDELRQVAVERAELRSKGAVDSALPR
jgi:hypothetical protein